MAEHKGTITLVIATLILFGIWVFFGNNFVRPIITEIGNQFTDFAKDVFTQTSKSESPAVKPGTCIPVGPTTTCVPE